MRRFLEQHCRIVSVVCTRTLQEAEGESPHLFSTGEDHFWTVQRGQRIFTYQRFVPQLLQLPCAPPYKYYRTLEYSTVLPRTTARKVRCCISKETLVPKKKSYTAMPEMSIPVTPVPSYFASSAAKRPVAVAGDDAIATPSSSVIKPMETCVGTCVGRPKTS